MGCIVCDCSTPRRKCRQCAIEDRAEEQAKLDMERDRDWPECPECGEDTSGEGVVCYRCRTVGGETA